MDNGTHTLFGAALAKTKLGRLHRLAPLSLIVGANLPDSDLVVGLFGGKNAFLIHHRGVTHALLGVVVEALLLAAALRWFERWRARTAANDPAPPAPLSAPDTPNAPAGWSAYLWPALAGLLSHPLLDALNTYGIRPWLPFSDARYFGDLVFIVDPWLWLIFGGAALLAGRRSALGTATWIALATVGSLVVFTNARTPEHVKVAWPCAIALLAALRWAGVGVKRPARPLWIGALLFVTYLGGLEWCARTAVANFMATVPSSAPVTSHFVMRSPTIANPLRWSICYEFADEVRWRIVALDGSSTRIAQRADVEIPTHLSDPRVQRAMALPAAAAWRYFVRVPTAWVETAADGSDHVFLSDARFQWGRGLDWCVVEIDLSKEGGAADGAGGDKTR
jgi:inner membrane protein